MPAPFEIIIGPAEVYVAPVGTPFPDVDEVPTAPWEVVGTLGDENYGEKGVIVRRSVTATPVRVLGSTTPRKWSITETGFQVEFDVIDTTPEQMALAYGRDPAEVEETPASSGVAGEKHFDIPTDPVPFQRAVLVRVPQAAGGENQATQWEVFAALQVGPGEGTFAKGDPFMLTHIWEAVKTESGFVRVRGQTDEALT